MSGGPPPAVSICENTRGKHSPLSTLHNPDDWLRETLPCQFFSNLIFSNSNMSGYPHNLDPPMRGKLSHQHPPLSRAMIALLAARLTEQIAMFVFAWTLIRLPLVYSLWHEPSPAPLPADRTGGSREVQLLRGSLLERHLRTLRALHGVPRPRLHWPLEKN